MRQKLRDQLRRQKARPASFLNYWGQTNGVNIPWTVGQRKWMQGKIRDSISAVFSSMASKPRPDNLIMSTEAYDAYKSALMHQEVE